MEKRHPTRTMSLMKEKMVIDGEACIPAPLPR